MTSEMKEVDIPTPCLVILTRYLTVRLGSSIANIHPFSGSWSLYFQIMAIDVMYHDRELDFLGSLCICMNNQNSQGIYLKQAHVKIKP